VNQLVRVKWVGGSATAVKRRESSESESPLYGCPKRELTGFISSYLYPKIECHVHG
jgi:hypothetical protein